MSTKVNYEKVIKPKRNFKMPHTYVILFSIIILVSILTYVVPAGEFERMEDPETERTIVVPDSYHAVEQNPTSAFDFIKAVPNGLEAAAQIVFFIFIVGGAFEIINSTGAVEGGISKIALSLKNKEFLMIPIFLLVFSIGGSTFGMAEETIVFIPIGVALARALGYDSMTGTAMIILGAAVGFTSGFMNPFTVGVAQGIAELPLFSGIAMRFVILIVLIIVTTIYIMKYAEKVKKNPDKSVVSELEKEEKHKIIDLKTIPKLQSYHYLVLLIVAAGFGLIIFGVFKYGWYIKEIGSIFLAMGIVGGLIGKEGPSKIAENFVLGAKSMAFGALVVGIARGILVIMEEGMIIDSVINTLASSIDQLPNMISSVGMFFVQVIINFFIPSGSGQAAATMPIMVPLSDIVGITRQTAVMAYQFGDGFTNSIIPTSASLMASLSIAKIPYEKWVKFLWPLMLIWLVVGMAFLIVANIINYGPF